MRKEFKLFCSVFVFLVVFLGLEQIKHQNQVFAETLRLCCEGGECQTSDQFVVPCSSFVSIKYYPACTNDYSTDCYECLDLWASGWLCGEEIENYYCDDNGENYYGNPIK